MELVRTIYGSNGRYCSNNQSKLECTLIRTLLKVIDASYIDDHAHDIPPL